MKKFLFILALAALTMNAQAAFREYLCGITEVSVDTLKSNSKNQFTITFQQKCKNIYEYESKPDTYYESTVKLVLNSDDRTLEGVYTTAGADPNKSSANVNDQTINLVTSEFTSGSTSRLLRKDSISTFVITKVDESHYAIVESELYFSKRLDQSTDTWLYRYSYDADEILNKDISQTPFIFGYESEFKEKRSDYDMTVNGINVIRDDTDYEGIRYFLTLNCSGKNRETSDERNYEVQLAIYPSEASIVGTFATQGGGHLMYSSNSYVKDLKIDKTRYLANDSISSIQIKAKGENLFSFFGGTLICTDVDLNYQAVYGKKRVTETHYYHFSDNNGEGIEFGYDESNKTVTLDITRLTVSGLYYGYRYEGKATDGKLEYNFSIDTEAPEMTGTFTPESGMSLWSYVSRGSNAVYVTSGSTLTINHKSGNHYTLSGSLLCENEYTYIFNPYEFQFGEPMGVEEVQRDKVQSTKVLRDGQLYLMYEGRMYDVQGKTCTK